MKQKPHLLRLHRTSAALPASVPMATHRVVDVYDPWFCVTCGHPHHFMTRHHRIPKRVAWKIPEDVQRQILEGDARVVPMCPRCHAFVENRKGVPCPERPDPRYALLGYDRLIREICQCDRVAYEITEDLIRRMRAECENRLIIKEG
jgi:hypothetical protein